MTVKKLLSILTAAALAGTAFGAALQDKVGICFRFDDNQPVERWQKLAEVFEKHGYRFSMAINSEAAAADPQYARLLADMAARGYEVMDHTPEHTVIQMTLASPEAAQALAGEEYVDHVAGRVVYFKFNFDSKNGGIRELTLSLEGNRILNGGAAGLQDNHAGCYVVMPDGAIYLVAKNGSEFKLLSKHCEDNVNLPKMDNVKVRLADRGAFTVDDRALAQLAQHTRELYKAMGVPAPRTLVTPGGWGLYPGADQIQRVYGQQFQYAAADQFYPWWNNTFSGNKLDRYRMAPFWQSLETNSVEQEKKLFADLLATNHVVPVISHLWLHGVNNSLDELLKRNDEFLAWVKSKNIPVRNYAEWADILYSAPADPACNIFPAFDRDLNDDGIPDGFDIKAGITVKDGVLTGQGEIFYISSLGGFTPGRSVVRVEGKAGAGRAKLILVFFFCGPYSNAAAKTVNVSFDFTSDTEFAAAEKELEVPEWVAGAHVTAILDGAASIKGISVMPVAK